MHENVKNYRCQIFSANEVPIFESIILLLPLNLTLEISSEAILHRQTNESSTQTTFLATTFITQKSETLKPP